MPQAVVRVSLLKQVRDAALECSRRSTGQPEDSHSSPSLLDPEPFSSCINGQWQYHAMGLLLELNEIINVAELQKIEH